MSHYYTNDQNLPSKEVSFEYFYEGERFVFYTDYGVFSKTQVDYGTYLLINEVRKHSLGSSVLDLGCGYGVVGIVLKTLFKLCDLTSVDINPRAVELAKLNYPLNNVEGNCFVSNIYENIEGKFSHIVTNPPIRAGKVVIYQMFEEAYTHLEDNGCLWVVIRKAQGAKSAITKINEVFGNCETIRKEKGYFILKAKKVDKLTML